MLSNYLGEEGDKSFLTAAAAVSSPMRTWMTVPHLESSFFGLYNKHFGKRLREKIEINIPMLKDHVKSTLDIDLETEFHNYTTVNSVNTLIGRMFGYKDLDDYYYRGSVIHSVPKIKVPFFYLYSKDDPVTGYEHIDFETCYKNPNIMVGVTERGAHVCFFESVINPTMWFPKPVIEFFNSFRKENK